MNPTITRHQSRTQVVAFEHGPAAKVPLGILCPPGCGPSIETVAATIAHLTGNAEPAPAGEYQLTWGHGDGGWIGVEHIAAREED